MLGMDELNVNWSVFEKINDEKEKLEHPSLFNMGSSGLHLIPATFETGTQVSA